MEELFIKDGTIPDPRYKDNAEFKIVQTIIRRQLESGETDEWEKCQYMHGISEETSSLHFLSTTSCRISSGLMFIALQKQ